MQDRRGFLKSTSALALSSSLLSAPVFASPTHSGPERKEAAVIDPIARNGRPMFKYSLAAYSYRNLLQGEDAEMSLVDFINDCADFDLHGTELTSYYFPSTITPVYLRQLKQLCFRLGLSVSGTAVRNDFGHPEGEQRRKDIDHVKRWVDYAEILGAPAIRIFAGHQKEGTTEAQSHSLIVSAIEECCEYAGRHGVHLALENHGGPTSTAEGLLKFVHDVKSPWFGVNLDTGNFHSDDIYGELERVAPYAINVQVKVKVSGPDGEKKDADFERIAKILKSAHYRGFVVLEFEEQGDPRDECKNYLAKMRESLDKVLSENL